MNTTESWRLIKYICYFLLLLIIVWFIAVALLASPNDPLYSTVNPSAISEAKLLVMRAVDIRSFVENRVENLPINFDKEWHAHSCLASNYRFRDLTWPSRGAA